MIETLVQSQPRNAILLLSKAKVPSAGAMRVDTSSAPVVVKLWGVLIATLLSAAMPTAAEGANVGDVVATPPGLLAGIL
jgi:hypothetical protein